MTFPEHRLATTQRNKNVRLDVARWFLGCPSCNTDFTYCEVSDESGLFAWSGAKPEFPGGGLTIKCPNCESSDLYQRSQLIYESSQESHSHSKLTL